MHWSIGANARVFVLLGMTVISYESRSQDVLPQFKGENRLKRERQRWKKSC